MITIEAPNRLAKISGLTSVFMAGGITGCPDWQTLLIHHLWHTDLVLFNPRRRDFPIDDPDAAQGQIEWEHYYLDVADRILFWFPKETLCPIVLYELGRWTKSNKFIAIGIEPGYQREQDVRIQTALERPEVPIVDNLADLALAIR